MSALPPCAGKWELFDSVDMGDHRKAKALCQGCPMIAGCRERLSEARAGSYSAYGPAGTWAGELVGATGVNNRDQMAIEETMFSIDEAKAAHAAYRAGDTSQRAGIGYRVHERRRNRIARAKAAEVAA